MGKRRDNLIKSRHREQLQQQMMSARLQPSASSWDHLLAYKDALLRTRIERWISETVPPESLGLALQSMSSGEVVARHQGIIALRQILAAHPEVAQAVIDGDGLRLIFLYAQEVAQPHLAFEALACLGALAGGDTARGLMLVQRGAVKALLEGAQSPYVSLAEQALRGLSALCGLLADARREIVRQRGISIALAAYQRGRPALTAAACGLFARVCRQRPTAEPLEILEGALGCVFSFICNAVSPQTPDLDECFSGVAQCIKSKFTALFEQPAFIHRLGGFYRHQLAAAPPRSDCLSACHRIFGGLTNLSDDFTDSIVAEGVLEGFAQLLGAEAPLALRKEVCWVLCNVAMGRAEHIERVMSTPMLLDCLYVLTAHPDGEMSKEALWVVCCLCKCDRKPFIANFFERGLLAVLLAALRSPQSAKTCLALEALLALLGFFAQDAEKKQVLRILIETGIADQVEQLQLHAETAVFIKARRVLTDHFPLES